MMDDATRARLVDACNDPAYTFPKVRRKDVFAILYAYDALRAERDRMMPCYEDARTTAARLVIEQEEYVRTVRNLTERAEFAQARATAAEAAQAQAAPVLAAAEAVETGWRLQGIPVPSWEQAHEVAQLCAVVAAWRAAREE